MKIRSAVLTAAVLALALTQCKASCEAGNLIVSAAYAACQAKAGPLCEPPTLADCDTMYGGNTSPGAQPSALSLAETCPSYTGDDPCVACVLSHCCDEARACFSEETCTCLNAKQTPGVSWPDDEPCGEEDDAYHAETACLSTHCAAACAGK